MVTLSALNIADRYPYIAATFNLIIGAAGAGLLSYPFAMRSAGVGLTIIFTAIFAMLNSYGLNLLAKFTVNHYSELRAHTYEELVGVVLGPRAYRICLGFLLWNVVGGLIGFLIIIGDLGAPPLQHAFSCGDHLLCSRGAVIGGVCVVAILPLSMLKDFHSLWLSSLLGVAGVLVVCGAIIGRGAEAVWDRSRMSWFNAHIELVYSINIIIFALGCQIQIIPQVSDLIKLHVANPSLSVPPTAEEEAAQHSSDAERSDSDSDRDGQEVKRRFRRVVWMTVVFCSILYNITGLFGYVAFYENTAGNILSNYPDTDVPMDVARFVMAIHVILAFPVNIYPGRQALEYLYKRNPKLFTIAGIAAGVGATDSNAATSGGSDAEKSSSAVPAVAAETPSNPPTPPLRDDEPLLSGGGGGGAKVSAGTLSSSVLSTTLGSPSASSAGRRRLPNSSGNSDGGSTSGGSNPVSDDDDPALSASANSGCCGSRFRFTKSRRRMFAQNVGFIVSTGLVATWFPQVQVVFALVGASSSCILTYVFPGLMDVYGRRSSKDSVAAVDTQRSIWRSQLFWIFGVVSGVFSTVVIIYQLIDQAA